MKIIKQPRFCIILVNKKLIKGVKKENHKTKKTETAN